MALRPDGTTAPAVCEQCCERATGDRYACMELCEEAVKLACPRCGGEGYVANARMRMVTCPQCDGNGYSE